MEFYRSLTDKVLSGLKRSPAILLVGARQSGKTFLMKEIAKEREYNYKTFDNVPTLASAHHDPVGFISELPKPAILDEVQRVPELFLPIKADIDENRTPGRYALTGSANPLVVPKLGDSLAGRMLLYELFPLSQGEIEGKKEGFLDRVFSEEFSFSGPCEFSKAELIARMSRGGYPEMQKFSEGNERREWVDSYLSLAMQKDIQDLSKVEGLGQLPNLLVTLATRIGSLLNFSDLSNGAGIPVTTLRRYIQLLHSLFLVKTLPPWSRNIGKRLVKSPKIYFIDTAILLQLLNFSEGRLVQTPTVLGAATENFVVLELFKQISWSSQRIQMFHFRTETRNEVDLVLENEMGKIVGIEIKSSETVRADDFKHFQYLRESARDSFARGIVLYAGNQILSFGPDLIAAPISVLWK